MHSEVSQEDGVCLDAVALFIVICGIQQLPGEIGPLTSDSFVIKFSHLYQQFLKSEDSPSVDSLQEQIDQQV